MRSVIFQGGFCRVVRVANSTSTTYVVEMHDGTDALGQPRWVGPVVSTLFSEVLQELAARIDDLAPVVTAPPAPLKKK